MGVCFVDITISFGFGNHNIISWHFSGVHIRTISINYRRYCITRSLLYVGDDRKKRMACLKCFCYLNHELPMRITLRHLQEDFVNAQKGPQGTVFAHQPLRVLGFSTFVIQNKAYH